jgi:sialic acid synthase SpsE
MRHVARKGKPMIISTGAAEQEWIDAAVRIVKDAGNDAIILTHCVSVYPAPVRLANVRAVPALRQRLGTLVGFSDHTLSNSAALAAVALGACYVEKHITLSRALPEGDNSMSVEPQEFRALVQSIREVEVALGTGCRSVQPEEQPLIAAARRGVYARRAIRRDQKIEPGMLAVRRPLSEIPADQIQRVVGRSARVDIAPEEGLRWEQLTVGGPEA